jgi:hypothetical protein
LTVRVNGTNYGGESQQLSATHLPPQTPTGSISNGAITISHNAANFAGANNNNGGGGGVFGVTSAGASITASQAGSTFTGNALPGQNSTAFGLLQPSIGTQKIIRAC